MNNGAKLVVVLVVIFAGAGLYMAFFPPGGTKKTPTETGMARTPERTPSGGSGARPVTPGTSTPPVRPPVPIPAPNTPRDGATGAPSGAGAPAGTGSATPAGTGAASGTATATPTPSGANAGANGAPTGPTPPGTGTAGGGGSTPPPVAPTPTPPPVAPPPPSRPVTPPAPSPAREYTVLEGDTFSSIAEEYFGDRRKSVLIAEANPTVDPMRLAIGQRIKLPAQDAALPRPAATGAGSASGSTGTANASNGASENAGTTDVAPTTTAAGRYTIRKGDTLASISERFYGTKAEGSWRRIFEANKVAIGEDPSRLKVGSAIVIPPRGA